MNSCIHSGSNDYSSGDTVWYNYAIASAGTINNKDATDDIGNINTTTESICPTNWTLPSKKQMDSNRSIADFSPTLGGHYSNSSLYDITYGLWWGAEAHSGANRYYLGRDSSGLYTGVPGYRSGGFYIRCVSEEKTVLDLTYMQDMTPAIVGFLSVLSEYVNKPKKNFKILEN